MSQCFSAVINEYKYCFPQNREESFPVSNQTRHTGNVAIQKESLKDKPIYEISYALVIGINNHLDAKEKPNSKIKNLHLMTRLPEGTVALPKWHQEFLASCYLKLKYYYGLNYQHSESPTSRSLSREQS